MPSPPAQVHVLPASGCIAHAPEFPPTTRGNGNTPMSRASLSASNTASMPSSRTTHTLHASRSNLRRTALLGTRIKATCFSFLTDHTRTVLSSAALAMKAPSWEKEQQLTGDVCPTREPMGLALGSPFPVGEMRVDGKLPQLDDAIVRGGSQHGREGSKCHKAHPAR
eukprot:CAMPEP_0169432568 /NCGR_PEP_ID=MMETSP1042-20121227/3559_1 /TAXON_ID=464988 /ORGANISM="Hemiselmis andersenii, Strain CCMP1180" /LENGTH=166 /DNA_ID=CAMNT_0009543073 /DNA_START=106 /DNA_END=602 /DNA_ORIENTATION=-